jgi:carbon-monoxide dehydrogenase medium subunit
MATAIEPGELLTEIRFPSWRSGAAWAIDEIARRKGDFALVGAALRAELDNGANIRDVTIVMFGVGGKPQRIESAESMLKGRRVDAEVLRELGRVVAEELEPDSDIHASAEYRKEVGGVLARRALESALARSENGVGH